VDRRLTAVAAVHGAVALLHGVPHQAANVALAGWQQAVVAFTVLGPFVAAAYAQRRPRASDVAFVALMVVSAAFGVGHHWLLPGVDNVRNVSAPHHATFEATAVALAAVGAVGALAGYSRSAR